MNEEDVIINEKKTDVEPPKGRAAMMEYLKEIDPDNTYEDDDGAIDYLLGGHRKMRENSNKLVSGIQSNPRNAELIQAIMKGENMLPHIVKMYGKSVLELDPESEDLQAIIKAEDERIKSEQEAFERTTKSEKEFEDNLAKSDAVFQEFITEEGMSEDEFTEMLQWAYDLIYAPAFTGLYTKEGLELLKKAWGYEKDLSDALEAGKAATRTEKIRAMSKENIGDGIPSLSGSSGKTDLNRDEKERGQIPVRTKKGGFGSNTQLIK